jgi:transposase
MIVIGADTHKASHALVAVDGGSGRVLSEHEIPAEEAGHLQALRWAHELGSELIWAIEDCRHVSARLERALMTAGERVLRVPPKLMGASRRGEREPGKSDQIDARAVARAVLKEGVDRFPAAHLDEAAMEIRLLADHREDLIVDRTRATNRLRWHLVLLCPDLEAKIPSRQLDDTRQLDRINRRLRTMKPAARVQIALKLASHIRQITRDAKTIERELHALVKAHRPQLLAELGCGTITAAILIGHTAGAQRFSTDAHFARMAGVAPIPASSGKRDRHRLHRGGDRQLNRALHVIAISRGRRDPATRAYLHRKQTEGKTRMEALRCLKRQLARHFHRLLLLPPATHTQRPPITGSAPAAMICLT